MKPTFAEAFRFWLKLGFVNFGGPAGQIALMHDELVERRKWISEPRFLHALNYCMLLPGPEAMQLATYVGWLLHGTRGGLAAGLLFILPGALLMLLLTAVYAAWGEVAAIAGVVHGLKIAVVALVAAAVIRIGRKALKNPALWAIATTAFVSMFFFNVSFAIVVPAAAVAGAIGFRLRPGAFKPLEASKDDAVLDSPAPSWSRFVLVTALHLALWAAPILALGLWRGWSDTYVRLALFFSLAAMVTFGGAYAVLSYVAQAAVGTYHWMREGEMAVGLGLAESTPGPLILVVQFVGFLAAFHANGDSLAAGSLGAAVVLWVTFVPCFLWIFLGAPYVERLRGRPALDAMMTAITAAVVGVILNLALWLALRVLFREVAIERLGPLVLNVPRSLDWLAFLAAAVAFVGIARWKWNMIAVVGVFALLGLAARLIAVK